MNSEKFVILFKYKFFNINLVDLVFNSTFYQKSSIQETEILNFLTYSIFWRLGLSHQFSYLFLSPRLIPKIYQAFSRIILILWEFHFLKEVGSHRSLSNMVVALSGGNPSTVPNYHQSKDINKESEKIQNTSILNCWSMQNIRFSCSDRKSCNTFWPP